MGNYLDEFFDGIDNCKEDKEKLTKHLYELNKIICGDQGRKCLLNVSYCIGPAYLGKYNGSFSEIWNSRIKPLLLEYCRGQKPGAIEDLLIACENAFIPDEE